MDIAFYGINLNQSIILSQIGFAPKGLSPWETLFKQALGNLILSVLGALPGYIGKNSTLCIHTTRVTNYLLSLQ